VAAAFDEILWIDIAAIGMIDNELQQKSTSTRMGFWSLTESSFTKDMILRESAIGTMVYMDEESSLFGSYSSLVPSECVMFSYLHLWGILPEAGQKHDPN